MRESVRKRCETVMPAIDARMVRSAQQGLLVTRKVSPAGPCVCNDWANACPGSQLCEIKNEKTGSDIRPRFMSAAMHPACGRVVHSL